jgi:hypothetical protein
MGQINNHDKKMNRKKPDLMLTRTGEKNCLSEMSLPINNMQQNIEKKATKHVTEEIKQI